MLSTVSGRYIDRSFFVISNLLFRVSKSKPPKNKASSELDEENFKSLFGVSKRSFGPVPYSASDSP